MSPLSRKLASAVLTRVLSRSCESIIPRSGQAGAAVNCFASAVDKGNEPYLKVHGLSNGMLTCIEWDGRSYEIERKLPLAQFELRDFRITHYYGLTEIRYNGILDFALNRITAWPYIQTHVVRIASAFDQYLFNKKKLFTKQRKELLKVLVNHALDGKTEHEPLDLMTDLYSIKWFLHPQGEDAQRRLEFYLDSLADTGELQKVHYKYVVTGQALRAMEEYEEQERKHTESVKMQWRMFWLALAIVALTVVQAGLVELPPLLDLTHKDPAK